MLATAPYPILLAAIAWCALIVPLVVFRYLNIPDKLYDLVSKGDVALVAGHIEESEVLPAIVDLIRKVVIACDQKAAQGITVIYEEILEEIDFRPSLAAAQQSFGKITTIDSTIEQLSSSSTPIWLLGLIHLVVVIGAAVDYLFVQDLLRMPLLWIAVTTGVLSFVLVLVLVVRFERRYRHLLKHLRNNRGR